MTLLARDWVIQYPGISWTLGTRDAPTHSSTPFPGSFLYFEKVQKGLWERGCLRQEIGLVQKLERRNAGKPERRNTKTRNAWKINQLKKK